MVAVAVVAEVVVAEVVVAEVVVAEVVVVVQWQDLCSSRRRSYGSRSSCSSSSCSSIMAKSLYTIVVVAVCVGSSVWQSSHMIVVCECMRNYA